jgi:hypothetical protein
MRYRSQLEAVVAKSFEKGGHTYLYEPLKIEYHLDCTYTPDFVFPNGVHIETKGFLPPRDRRKILAVLEQHPELDLRMVFQRNNPLAKGSKTTYGDWCDKHKIPWCVWPNLPEDWL